MQATFRRRARHREHAAAAAKREEERNTLSVLTKRLRRIQELERQVSVASTNLRMVWDAIPANSMLRAPANHAQDATERGPLDPYRRQRHFDPPRPAPRLVPGDCAVDTIFTYQVLELLDVMSAEDWEGLGWNLRVRLGDHDSRLVYGVFVSRDKLAAMPGKRRQQLLRLYLQEAADRLAAELGR